MEKIEDDKQGIYDVVVKINSEGNPEVTNVSQNGEALFPVKGDDIPLNTGTSEIVDKNTAITKDTNFDELEGGKSNRNRKSRRRRKSRSRRRKGRRSKKHASS